MIGSLPPRVLCAGHSWGTHVALQVLQIIRYSGLHLPVQLSVSLQVRYILNSRGRLFATQPEPRNPKTRKT